jgi:predicted nucleic-acid-binding protein
MKAVDTNVLVRFLVNDDPAQANAVRELFATAERQREAYWVPVLVVMEAIWVLESAYGVGRSELIATLNDLLLLPVLEFEHRGAVQRVLAGAGANAGDLPDLLIAETARQAGCEATLTFDKKAARAAGFELIAV